PPSTSGASRRRSKRSTIWIWASASPSPSDPPSTRGWIKCITPRSRTAVSFALPIGTGGVREDFSPESQSPRHRGLPVQSHGAHDGELLGLDAPLQSDQGVP